jgi:hypothetical protein
LLSISFFFGNERKVSVSFSTLVFPTRQDGVVDDHGPDVEADDKEDGENEAKVYDSEATKDDEALAETEMEEQHAAK